MTVLLREVGLLNDPALQGISVFNPIPEKDFKKTRYPGGVFLSRTTLKEFHQSIVFYDEGRELNKLLSLSSLVARESLIHIKKQH